MKKINFIVSECTSLRYFIPIVIEANSKGFQSNFYVGKSNKYNCPQIKKNKNELLNLCNCFNIKTFDLFQDKITDEKGQATIITESVGVDFLNKNNLNISVSSMTDFIVLYRKYSKLVDNVLLPSEFLANYYNDMKTYPVDGSPAGETLSNKNLYFGSPKYDVNLENFSYGLNNVRQKKILFFAPNRGDNISYQVFLNLVNVFQKSGFFIVVKSRGKHPVPKNIAANVPYFEDTHWFPHTSMVLIKEVDMAITFGSTVTKECVMLSKPFINFDFKKFKHLDFLKSKNACLTIENHMQIDYNDIVEKAKKMTSENFHDEFDFLRKKYLFEYKPGSVSRSLINFIEQTLDL